MGPQFLLQIVAVFPPQAGLYSDLAGLAPDQVLNE
jgi:hypothetical protein